MDGSGTTDRVDRAAQSAGVSAAAAAHTREVVDPLTVTRRLQREGRWKAQAEQTRDELMKASKGQFADKESRQQWVYGELDRMYPPLGETFAVPGSRGVGGDNVTPDAGQIQGLADIPEAWPELHVGDQFWFWDAGCYAAEVTVRSL